MRCTINGVHADALGTVGWVFTTGTEPHVQAFEMDAKEASKLINEGGPCSLVIEDAGRIMPIEGLEIIGEAPSSAPMFRTVLVADLRWKWSRKLVTGLYNVRRRTGQKHIVAGAGMLQIGQVIDDYEFQPASLKDETTKWKPREFVEDILKKLGDGADFEFEFDVDIGTDELEVNDVIVRDAGHTALQIALGHLPGTSLWVDATGKVHIYNAVNLKEAEVITKMGPDIVGEGTTRKVSYKHTRPRKINVFWVREQEVRHDSVDLGETFEVDARKMFNVAIVTDPVLTVDGDEVSYGSWKWIDSLMTVWNTDLPGSSEGFTVPPPISHTVIQQAFFHDALFRLYVPFGGDVPQPIWGGRINSVKAHYRQTYQINRRWVDRSFQVMAVRCGIIDPTTGTRGRSLAHGDFCVKVSMLPSNLVAFKGKLWHNFYGGRGGSGFGDDEAGTPFVQGTLLEDSNVISAVVSMVDAEAGIIHLDYKVDPYGSWKEIYPSIVDNLPSCVMNDKKSKGANMKIGESGNFPQLTANDHKAVVLTHVPSVPNNNGQFFKLSFTPGDVAGLVKGLTIEPAEGPELDILIDPGIATARMAWRDEFANEIERSFGIGRLAGAEGQDEALVDSQILLSLLTNEEHLQEIGRAAAAAQWSKMTDRYIGEKAVRLDPSVKIQGAIGSVSHEHDVEGRVITRVRLPEEFGERNYLALLSEGTRKVVFREVIP